VLEVGCSFGHITEYLAEQPLVREIATFETDPAFAAMVRVKVEEMRLGRVRDVQLLSNEETRRLPYPDGRFDVVLVLGVVEHLPVRGRRQIVDEYYRVLAPGGHIAILDTPNRLFPLETHSVGLPLIQWLPAPLAFAYAKLGRPGRMRGVDYAGFVMDGAGWRNASLSECLPSSGWRDLEDVTEEAGFGWTFFATPRARASAGASFPPSASCVAGFADGAVAVAGPAVPQPPSQKAESRDPSERRGAPVTIPAVSVLMGVWNGAPRVREAVGSVLGQTMGDLELIVIDDGSTDGTPAILESFGDPRLRVERRGRGGLTSASTVPSPSPAPLARAARRRRRGVCPSAWLGRLLIWTPIPTSACLEQPRARSTRRAVSFARCVLPPTTPTCAARSSGRIPSCTPPW
jgi:SAM-dependent methyltransferase